MKPGEKNVAVEKVDEIVRNKRKEAVKKMPHRES